jgi:hypothetical protein
VLTATTHEGALTTADLVFLPLRRWTGHIRTSSRTTRVGTDTMPGRDTANELTEDGSASIFSDELTEDGCASTFSPIFSSLSALVVEDMCYAGRKGLEQPLITHTPWEQGGRPSFRTGRDMRSIIREKHEFRSYHTLV